MKSEAKMCVKCKEDITIDEKMIKVVYDQSGGIGALTSMFKILQFHQKCFNKVYIFRDGHYDGHNDECDVCGVYCSDSSRFDRVVLCEGSMGSYYLRGDYKCKRLHAVCFEKYFLYPPNKK